MLIKIGFQKGDHVLHSYTNAFTLPGKSPTDIASLYSQVTAVVFVAAVHFFVSLELQGIYEDIRNS